MEKEKKSVLVESLHSLELAVIEGQKKGIYSLQNARVLLNSVEALNEYLTSIPVDEKVEVKERK